MEGHPFEDISEGRLENLNALQAQLATDSSPRKVNLMYGVYRPGNGQPLIFESVKRAKHYLFSDSTWNHEYPPSHLGTTGFREKSARLMFGESHPLLASNRIVTMQTVGASGACHMAALFLKLHYAPWNNGTPASVHIPADSWANHPNIFTFLDIKSQSLPYYSPQLQNLDFHAFNSAIAALPMQSVIVLQSSSQNPTGCDPTTRQWHQLARTFKARSHFAFFDAAYLGLLIIYFNY